MNKKTSIHDALILLSLPTKTDKTAVKKRYRELAKMYHPDQFNNYPEQKASVEQFYAIQAAYELLMSLPGEHIIAKSEIEVERELKKNPDRGTYTLPDWIIIEELKNSMYFIRLINKRAPSRMVLWNRIQTTFSKNTSSSASFGLMRIWNHLMNWLRWIVFSLAFLTLFVCAFVLMCSVVVCFMLFYPILFWGKRLNTLVFRTMYKKYGYYPSPTCGNTSGEIVYLLFRTFPSLMWCALTYYVWCELYKIGFGYLIISLPLGLFAIILLSSILYEWVCFLKVKRWKNKQH